ncbi:MAG TPA: L,D-transpeptidase [Candidatus Omnitrophota bacterium]|nr:L,D-transpeptidase [Candidatus Omnitrophota bacterium]
MKIKPWIILALIACLLLGAAGSRLFIRSAEPSRFYSWSFLDQKVQEIADRYSNGDVIVVSKQDHLLYYCHRGLIVRGDRMGGFVFNFPVPVSLGANNRWTPEGEFKVYTKNPHSRFTLFMGFCGLYGIHGASTRLASKLDYLEALNPNLKYVTRRDNTLGCVAVENRVIKYLYARVDVNTPVLIMP